MAIRLTEVEAYRGDIDPGSHAYRGMTPRTAPMFERAGTLYAYFTYGMHTCLNVVVGPEGVAEACLLRAGEVIEGVELARERRMAARKTGSARIPDRELARGPASLVRALGGELADSGRRADEAPYWLELPSAEERVRLAPAVRTLRVGVSGAGGLEPFDWRFHLEGDPTVSRFVPGKRSVRGRP
ncbi:Putative 3-methyladenine DNA glycosylase [Pseudoclavibacter triregionum]|nr:Putative 3-methyladenine DNA glycosylase [Pseudoclavibacter triregionum]